MNSYYDMLAEMTALGGFDILGHAEIIKKNCQDKTYWSAESELSRQREIAFAVSRAGAAAEVNTGGLNRGKTRDTYPSLSFLRLFREQGVPIIITADAHRAADIDGNYDVAVQTLVNAGYSEHVLFSGRQEGKAVWRSMRL
jgi:histidinol-phosphatase (PHP family)